MKIREYNESDTDELIEIWRAASAIAHPFLAEPFLAEEAKNMREIYLPNAKTWVIESEERGVGFIAMIGNEIGGLFLHPDHHGQGAGKSMVEHAFKQIGPLKVEVFEQNSIGRKFYDRYGFSESGRYEHEASHEQVIQMAMKGAS